MIAILMGAAGVGKTTVGEALAGRRGARFVDADDLHSAASVAKLRAGVPLTDEDRAPWLAALRSAVAGWLARGEDVVLACSALRQSYRDVRFRPGEPVRLVYLKASREVLQERLAHRRGHFMNPSLLDDQLRALEEPQGAIVIDAEAPVAQVVEATSAALDRSLAPIR